MSDKNDSTWQFAYSGTGRLDGVTDPLSQVEQFDFYSSINDEGHYTDVRGKLWKYLFSPATQNLVATTNPLNESWTLAYADPRPQLAHEATAATNALNKTWATTYDDHANVLTTTDPLGNVTSFTYDSLHNLRTTAPPDDLNPGMSDPFKLVEMLYEDAAHPTSPTSIIQPADGYGAFEAVTTIDYYGDDEFTGSDPADWNGQVYRVTGPNGVVTEYKYDEWGQQSSETENPSDPLEQTTFESWPTVTYKIFRIAAGLIIGAESAQRGHANCEFCAPNKSGVQRDAMGNVIDVECLYGLCTASCQIDPDEPDPVSVLTDGCFMSTSSPTGQPESIHRCVADPTTLESSERDMTIFYDPFDRPVGMELSTAEPTFDSPGSSQPITRAFTYDYDDVAGTVTTTGPDGETVTTTTDDAGRTKTVTRTTPAGDITAEYTYDAAGRVTLVENGNGMDVRYEYDDANRMTQMRYENASDQSLILQLDYDYTADGLIWQMERTDAQGGAGVLYEYDFRNRLVSETHYETTFFALIGYTYDQGGNRLTKDVLSNDSIRTYYHYDVTDEDDGGQHNNRLLSTEVVDLSTEEVIERTWYLYGAEGNVARLIKETLEPTPETRVY